MARVDHRAPVRAFAAMHAFLAANDLDAVTALLRAQLAGLPGRSPFYADLFAGHGIDPGAFRSLPDLARFPFTDKGMLRDSQAAAPPLGPGFDRAFRDEEPADPGGPVTTGSRFFDLTRLVAIDVHTRVHRSVHAPPAADDPEVAAMAGHSRR